jgi:hypothetical protein
MDGNAWAVVIVGALSLAGTIVGTFGGIRASAKLTGYRIEQLEKKVDKHNCLVERTYKLEERCELFEERFKVSNHRIEDLEKGGG